MKNLRIKIIIKILINIVQVFILIPPIVLQYLSDKKMGVKRYLVFQKEMLPKEIFTDKIMIIYKFILILGIIISIALLIHYSIMRLNNPLKKSAITVIIFNLLAAFYVFSKLFDGLLAYHFFLIAIFVIISLQYIKILLDYKKSITVRYI